MLGSPAFAHELSGSTCAADVVFLWDKKGQFSSGAATLEGVVHGAGGTGKRLRLVYGHTQAVIDAVSATGADVRFGTAEQ